MSRRKVLIVASTLHVGGAERVMATLARNFDRAEFDVTVVYLKEPGVVADELLQAGVKVVPLPGRDYGRKDRFTFLKLRRFIRDEGFEIVHTHDMHGFMDAAFCRLLSRGFRHVHTFHFGNYPHRSARYKRMERLLWRVPDALVAVGHTQAGTIRDLYGIPERRLHVIWNGVDATVPEVSEELAAAAAQARAPVIASVSTLIPQKGLPHLLDALALLKRDGVPFKLLLVGGGDLMEPLRKQSQDLGLGEQVQFFGWVPRAAPRALPVCDIFVQSSLWEAMSVVVLEAMSCAKALVITNVGDNARVVEDGVTGLIVKPGDPAALAAGLRRVIEDPALRATLGQNALQRFRSHHTIDKMIANHQNLFRQLLTPNP